MRLLAAVTVGGLLLSSQAPPPGLAGEVVRVRARIGAVLDKDQQPAEIARVDRAGAALDAGRSFLALYLLEEPWEGTDAATFVSGAGPIATPAAFLKKWTLTGEPRPIAPAQGTRRPALVDALASAAEARGPITYYASKPYAEDANLDAGMFYLGESRALMRFAAMARNLDLPARGQAPPLRSIAAELTAFDTEMVTAYESMDRASHPTYIAASAALKQARTLNDRGQYAGALFEYLMSRYLFAGVRGPAAADATVEGIAEARRALTPGADQSIAELFLQLADEGVASDVPARRRGAAAVVDDVLPAYRTALAAPAPTSAAVPDARVTITLVRWPFT